MKITLDSKNPDKLEYVSMQFRSNYDGVTMGSDDNNRDNRDPHYPGVQVDDAQTQSSSIYANDQLERIVINETKALSERPPNPLTRSSSRFGSSHNSDSTLRNEKHVPPKYTSYPKYASTTGFSGSSMHPFKANGPLRIERYDEGMVYTTTDDSILGFVHYSTSKISEKDLSRFAQESEDFYSTVDEYGAKRSTGPPALYQNNTILAIWQTQGRSNTSGDAQGNMPITNSHEDRRWRGNIMEASEVPKAHSEGFYESVNENDDALLGFKKISSAQGAIFCANEAGNFLCFHLLW